MIQRALALARGHPFAVAQIVLLAVFVAGSAVAGFLVDRALGFLFLGVASLVAVIVIGQGGGEEAE